MTADEMNAINVRLTNACAEVKKILDKRDMYHRTSVNWQRYQTAAEVAYEDVSDICNELNKQHNAQEA